MAFPLQRPEMDVDADRLSRTTELHLQKHMLTADSLIQDYIPTNLPA